MELITKPKNKDLDRINANRVVLTQNDFRKIFSVVEILGTPFQRERNGAIMSVLMTTGMRRTALCNILLEDYDEVNKRLVVIDKGNKRHEYELTDTTNMLIKRWLSYRDKKMAKYRNQHLFITYYGNPLSGDEVYEMVERYTKAALGKALSPHKLRSGYCSILYKKTGDIEFVRRAVGHANVATTQRYIVTRGEEKKKAAEIMGSIF